MSADPPPLDPEAVWNALNPSQQLRVGIAAIIATVGRVRYNDGEGTLGDQAARMTGEDALEDALFEECGLDSKSRRPDLAALGVRACSSCGCTDDYGCPEGCSWVGDLPLCSACVNHA